MRPTRPFILIGARDHPLLLSNHQQIKNLIRRCHLKSLCILHLKTPIFILPDLQLKTLRPPFAKQVIDFFLVNLEIADSDFEGEILDFNQSIDFLENLENSARDDAVFFLQVSGHFLDSFDDDVDDFVGAEHRVGFAGARLPVSEDGPVVAVHQCFHCVFRSDLVQLRLVDDAVADAVQPEFVFGVQACAVK